MSKKKKAKEISREILNQPTVCLLSLGCVKNLVDSESFLGKLALEGYIISPEADTADLVIINTCGFIEDAKLEAKQAFSEIINLRKKHHRRGILAFGCLVQREGVRLFEEFKDIDGFLGLSNFRRFKEACDKALHGERFLWVEATADKEFEDESRLVLTPGHYAYLRLSDGCDNRCSYCTIPLIRGRLKSKPLEKVLAEAQDLVAGGARELICIGQDTTSYGRDLYGQSRLCELVRELEKLEGLRWIRLLYTHPAHWSEELMELMAAGGKLLPYADIPIQHISDKILGAMKRKITRAEIENLLNRLRERVPGIALRTSIIVGFPGETEEDFEELLKFAEKFRFDHLGAFIYSLESDTPAAALKPQIPENEKKKRLERILSNQQEIVFLGNKSLPEKAFDVIIDSYDSKRKVWLGRSYREAPDSDSLIFVKTRTTAPGEFVRVKVTDAAGYDLLAEPAKSAGK